LGTDTWIKVRRTLPKAAARGIAKGAQKGLAAATANLPGVVGLLLAHALAGPWGVVAALARIIHSGLVSVA